MFTGEQSLICHASPFSSSHHSSHLSHHPSHLLTFPFAGDKDRVREAAELPQRGEVRGEAGQGVPHQDQDRPSPGGADQNGQFSPPLAISNNLIMTGERMQGCARHRVQTAQSLEACDSKYYRVQVFNPTQFSKTTNIFESCIHIISINFLLNIMVLINRNNVNM